MANYKTMNERCVNYKLGFHPELVSDLVNRIQQVYLRDRVTVVAYQVAGITVKIKNLVILFSFW